MSRYLSQLCFLIVAILTGSLVYAAEPGEIAGNWGSTPQTGTEAVFLSFGADNSFFIDSQTGWYSGGFELEANDSSFQMILDVEDGSEVENIGKKYAYSYELVEETLIVDASQDPGILASQGSGERSVYVVIGNESDEDDDDDEFTLYASCFIETVLP